MPRKPRKPAWGGGGGRKPKRGKEGNKRSTSRPAPWSTRKPSSPGTSPSPSLLSSPTSITGGKWSAGPIDYYYHDTSLMLDYIWLKQKSEKAIFLLWKSSDQVIRPHTVAYSHLTLSLQPICPVQFNFPNVTSAAYVTSSCSCVACTILRPINPCWHCVWFVWRFGGCRCECSLKSSIESWLSESIAIISATIGGDLQSR